MRPLAALLVLAVLAGCGGSPSPKRTPAAGRPPLPQAPGLGHGPRFRPPSLGRAAAAGRPIGRLRCTRSPAPRYGAHLELFANGRVVLVAPGIGVAPPRVRQGAFVRGGRCSYPVRTREPTGVIEVDPAAHPTLGDFFAVWGQPLSQRRMAGFRGRVRAYVGGARRPGDPRSIPLTRHAEIVLEVGAYVPPHLHFRFMPGL